VRRSQGKQKDPIRVRILHGDGGGSRKPISLACSSTYNHTLSLATPHPHTRRYAPLGGSSDCQSAVPLQHVDDTRVARCLTRSRLVPGSTIWSPTRGSSHGGGESCILRRTDNLFAVNGYCHRATLPCYIRCRRRTKSERFLGLWYIRHSAMIFCPERKDRACLCSPAIKIVPECMVMHLLTTNGLLTPGAVIALRAIVPGVL